MNMGLFCFSCACRTLSPEIQEQLLNAIQKVFNYNRRQAENIYVELIVCMRKRQYITIYKMDDDASTEQEDVDQAILRTLLRYEKNVHMFSSMISSVF